MSRAALWLSLLALAGLDGCDWMPGKPTPAQQWRPPQDIVDFKTLYARNCQGCHGAGDIVGGVISLDNPMYVAVVPEEALRRIIIHGVNPSPMSAFAEENGGMLTDKQIDILIQGIKGWAPNPPPAGPLPPYAAPPGNAAAGEPIYAAYVDGVRKAAGEAVVGQGFLTNPAFLGLVSDQYLRTLIIAGRPELGIPNYQNAIPGRPLSDQDIADVVAWLISQRKNEFGQPLTTSQP